MVQEGMGTIPSWTIIQSLGQEGPWASGPV